MSLPQAQLGQMPMINLGGYIPAPVERLSPYEKALAAFLQGAAGTVAGNVVNRVLPDPEAVAMRNYRTRQLAQQDRIITNQEAAEARAAALREAELRERIRQFNEEFRRGLTNDQVNHYLNTGRLGNETRSTNANIRQGDRRLGQVDRQLGFQDQLVPTEINLNNARARAANATAETTEEYNKRVTAPGKPDLTVGEKITSAPGWAQQAGKFFVDSVRIPFDGYAMLGEQLGEGYVAMQNAATPALDKVHKATTDALDVTPQTTADAATWAAPVLGWHLTDWLKKKYLENAQ